jgi:hypothetical protein
VADERKGFLLRIPESMLEELRRWAEQRLGLVTEADVATDSQTAPAVSAPVAVKTKPKDFFRPSRVVADISQAMSVRYNNMVYDLRQDPEELVNLRNRVSRKWLNDLAQLARDLSSCAGKACRQIESRPVPRPPL